jgi:hypothetical protein
MIRVLFLDLCTTRSRGSTTGTPTTSNAYQYSNMSAMDESKDVEEPKVEETAAEVCNCSQVSRSMIAASDETCELIAASIACCMFYRMEERQRRSLT